VADVFANQEPGDPPTRDESPDVVKHRMNLGRDIVALAIVAAVGVAGLSIVVYTTAQEAAAVIGLFTTLVGTLAGMIFGASIGQKSAQQALAQANQAQVASLYVDPGNAESVLRNSTLNGNPEEGF
jgi:hypothetical protein